MQDTVDKQVTELEVYYSIVEPISYDENNVHTDTSFREKCPIKIIKNKIVLFQFSLTHKTVYIVRYKFLVAISNKNKFGFFWNSILHFVFIKQSAEFSHVSFVVFVYLLIGRIRIFFKVNWCSDCNAKKKTFSNLIFSRQDKVDSFVQY